MVSEEVFGACSPDTGCSLPAPVGEMASTPPVTKQVPRAKLRLDIVSDTICPWCYVAKRRITEALEALGGEGIAFDVTWRPFQLNPQMPTEGLDRRAYRSAKFGSWEKSQALDAQVTVAGQTVGLTFRHDLMERTPNTLASHVLIRLARETGGSARQDAVVEALFAAYFTQGRDVGNHEVLADVGAEAGIERNLVVGALAEQANFDAIGREEGLAHELGLNGVPSVVLEGYYLFSGAQPVPVIIKALRGAATELSGAAAPEPHHVG